MQNTYLEKEEKLSFGAWARELTHNPENRPIEKSHTVVVEDFAGGVGMVGLITEATKGLSFLIPKKAKELNLFRFDRKVVDRNFHHITVYYLDI